MARLDNELLNYKSKYQNGEVLNNKLGITDPMKLEEIERKLTAYKLSKLYLDPGKQTFDVNHYLSIHKYLFGEIYDFAGEIRNENINKVIPFCLPQLVYPNLKFTLDTARHMVKKLTDVDKLIKYVSSLYSDLDVIHPFREGNGRTEREFIRQYIDYVCKTNNLELLEIDYSRYDKDEFINAIIKADISCNYEELEDIFRNLIVKSKTR